MDYITGFIYQVYYVIWNALEPILSPGFDLLPISDPIVFIAFSVAYIFCVIYIIKLIVGSIRWFYRI